MNLELRYAIADRKAKTDYIAKRVVGDPMTILLADGRIHVDLHSYWSKEGGYHLEYETNCPEWADLDEIYRHFRWLEMLPSEQRHELGIVTESSNPIWDGSVLSYRRRQVRLRRQANSVIVDVFDRLQEHNWTTITLPTGLRGDVKQAIYNFNATHGLLRLSLNGDRISWR
jgi:hypothetical protein